MGKTRLRIFRGWAGYAEESAAKIPFVCIIISSNSRRRITLHTNPPGCVTMDSLRVRCHAHFAPGVTTPENTSPKLGQATHKLPVHLQAPPVLPISPSATPFTHTMDFILDQLGLSELRRLNPRQILSQILNFGLILGTAFMLWKGLSVATDSPSPIVVVLSGRFVSYSAGFPA